MGLSRAEARSILGVSAGAEQDVIIEKYKMLANENLPDRHAGSLLATEKFNAISLAYNRLTQEDSDSFSDDSWEDGMSHEEKMAMFTRMMFAFGGAGDSDHDGSDLDDGEYEARTRRRRLRKPDPHVYSTSEYLTKEEIEKNAQELITEEQKAKIKAEKRRNKKKRRREKKRQEKMKDNEPAEPSKAAESSSESEAPSDDEDFNQIKPEFVQFGKLHETYKTQTQATRKPKPTVNGQACSTESKFFNGDTEPRTASLGLPGHVNGMPNGRSYGPGRLVTQKKESSVPLIPKITTKPNLPVAKPEDKLKARQFAGMGNKYAEAEEFIKAIECYTRSISLDPADYRFYGNRSFCFERISDYQRALSDAEFAIRIKPDWPKAYFRKGQALLGMQNGMLLGHRDYKGAEEAFCRVLQLDPDCAEALCELGEVRVKYITDMGFSEAAARESIFKHGTKELALEALLANELQAQEIYNSDDEEEGFTTITSPANAKRSKEEQPAVAEAVSLNPTPKGPDYDPKLDPNNPYALKSLWVGNIDPSATHLEVQNLFAKVCRSVNVRLMSEKFCAFVNFLTPQDAGNAMRKLQGTRFYDQNLLIKFPDKPIKSSMTVPVVIPETMSNGSSKPPQPRAEKECFYWRMGTCKFGDNCFYRHIPGNEGIDWK